MKIDLHIHTSPLSACSYIDPQELMPESRRLKLDGICLTEHQVVWDPDEVDKLAAEAGISIFRGNEFTTNQGDILVFVFYEDIKELLIIQELREKVTAADGYLVIHPNWWAQPPAILKGWIDRVFCQGVAYEFGAQGSIVQHLAGKRAVVITTSNTPRDIELEFFGDPLENLWKNCIFGFCGVQDFQRRNFESIVMSTLEQRRQWLDEVKQIVAERFPTT